MTPVTRLSVLSAMRWFPVGLVVPVLILMLGARGLPLDQVGQVIALYGLVTLLLELPTGGLADSWGRRPVIVISAVVNAVGLAGLAFFGQVPAVVVCVALLGFARALSSGPLESWFVDEVDAHGPVPVEPGLAKGQIAESLALGAGSVIGGFLPRVASGLPQSGEGLIALSVPFLVACAMMLAFALAAAVLLSAQSRPARAAVGPVVRLALGRAVRQPPVRSLMLVALCLGVVLGGVELLSPNAFADLVDDPTAASSLYGVLTAAAFAVAGAGAALSTRMPGRRTRVGAGAFLALAVLALVISVPVLPVAAFGFLAVYAGIGLQGPVMAGLLHARVGSEVRSTMMSVESLALQFGGALASIVVGTVAAALGLVAGFGVVALAAVVAAAILTRDPGGADNRVADDRV
jgi:MFS family permease